GVVIQQRQRLGARVLVEQQRRGTRARRQGHRRIVQAPVGGDRGVRLAVARGNVGEVQLRRVVPLAAREQFAEALPRLLHVAGIERQQRQAAVHLGLG